MNVSLESAMKIIEKQEESARRNVTTSTLLRPQVTLFELECICEDGLEDVLEYAVEQCIRYAVSVAEFTKVLHSEDGIDKVKLAEADDSRKRTHNATNDAINALSRALKRFGRSNDWINDIAGNRAKYSKLAMLLAFEKIKQYKRKEAQ